MKENTFMAVHIIYIFLEQAFYYDAQHYSYKCIYMWKKKNS